jgi:hypothetical protein
VEKFGGLGHFVVRLDGRFVCTLSDKIVSKKQEEKGTSIGLLLTRSFCVTPRSIFLSHSGALPFSVANWTLNPACLKAAYGTAVSRSCSVCTRISEAFELD